MSTPQSPSPDQPFPTMGDETLAENSPDILPNRSPQSMFTVPPSPTDGFDRNRIANLPAMTATQKALQNVCKRKRLSSSGAKKKLVERLAGIGVLLAYQVRSLSIGYLEEGSDDSLHVLAKQKSPNWTANEAARLCHVVADPRHATAVGRLYNKIDSRAELDKGRNDPWSATFVDLLNDCTFVPVLPDPKDGLTEELLSQLDLNIHPYKRTGTFLKARWTKLRSKYSIAREKFTLSGQWEHDVFASFTDGDNTIAYMHCVFHGLPSVSAIVRALPPGSGVEAGLEEISDARAMDHESRSSKRRKRSDSSEIGKGLSDIEKAFAAPVEVNLNQRADTNVTSKFNEFDVIDRKAGTVNKLMELEATIGASIRSALMNDEEEYAEDLKNRLRTVQHRIDRALME